MFSCFLSVQGPPLGWQHPQGTAVHGPLTWFLGVMLGRRGRGPLAEFMLVVMRGWALFLPGGECVACSLSAAGGPPRCRSTRTKSLLA